MILINQLGWLLLPTHYKKVMICHDHIFGHVGYLKYLHILLVMSQQYIAYNGGHKLVAILIKLKKD